MRRYEKRPFFFDIKVCSRSPNQDFFRMEFDDSLKDVQEKKETTTKDLLQVAKSVAIDSDEMKMDNNNQSDAIADSQTDISSDDVDMEKGYEEATGQVRIEPDDSKEFEVKDKGKCAH